MIAPRARGRLRGSFWPRLPWTKAEIPLATTAWEEHGDYNSSASC